MDILRPRLHCAMIVALLVPAVEAHGSLTSQSVGSVSQKAVRRLVRGEVKTASSLTDHRSLETDFGVAGLSEDVQDKRPMVVMVMFDHRYQHIWDCWMDHWMLFPSKHGLEVVVYDEVAERHVLDWKKTHPSIKFALHTAISDDNGRMFHLLLNETGSRESASIGAAKAHRRWDSAVYESNFWRQIKARLTEGKDVLHMDVDAIPVGNLWTPIERALGNVSSWTSSARKGHLTRSNTSCFGARKRP